MNRIVVPYWFGWLILALQLVMFILQIVTDNLAWLIGNLGLLVIHFFTKGK